MRLSSLLSMCILCLSLPAAAQFPTELRIDTARPIGTVRPLILGNNLK